MRYESLVLLGWAMGCASDEPTKATTTTDPVDSSATADTGTETTDPCPRLEVWDDPLVLPVTWCADDTLDQLEGVNSELALTAGFDRWDDLVPDQDLFEFVGPCGDEPTADLAVTAGALPPSLDSSLLIPVSPPDRPAAVLLSVEASYHSPVTSPDTPCDAQYDLAYAIARPVGGALGIEFARDDACAPADERAAMMARTGASDCTVRFPTAWDIERFNAATGFDVALP